MDEVSAMKLAIAEAYKGATAVSPNPLVGCVVLNPSGEVIARGYHEFYGGPHAEVNALRNLSAEQLKNAHVIVTLEPCAHEGKTPSCAKMLAKFPIARVTYGLVDPNPLVSGQGAQILEAVGIKTSCFSETHPELKNELIKVCEAFLWNQTKKSPFVALKVASSLDGQIALKSGESKWITGEKSREHVHYLRACYDAILVGANTVRVDDPSLDIRYPQIKKENKVIVLDSKASLLSQFSKLKLAAKHETENIYWCVGENAKLPVIKNGPQILKFKSSIVGLELNSVLENLWQNKIYSVFVEGGAAIAGSFLQQGLINRLYLFQAPILLGAGGGQSWSQGLSLQNMKDRLELTEVERSQWGSDELVTGLLHKN